MVDMMISGGVVMSGKEVLENKLMILRKEVVGVEKNLNYDVTGAGGICDSYAKLICERVFNEAYLELVLGNLDEMSTKGRHVGYHEYAGTVCEKSFNDVYDQLKSNSLQK